MGDNAAGNSLRVPENEVCVGGCASVGRPISSLSSLLCVTIEVGKVVMPRLL